MRLAVKLGLSLGMLALCVWLVWPDKPEEVRNAFERLVWSDFWPYLVGYIALLGATHFTRAYRWNYLLAPLGARQPPGRLLAIASVGFMAILALPARLGEFVRPALIRKKGEITASAALGTIAVERIVDGLLVSLFVSGAFFARRGPNAPDWMMPAAIGALSVFVAASIFLGFALRAPRPTVRFCVRLTLLPRLAPRFAAILEDALLSMVGGFLAIKDRKAILTFVCWSATYWLVNGISVLVLARAFGIELSFVAAIAITGFIAVGIMIPNSPGLVGQYEWLVSLGLSVYLDLGSETAEANALAFGIVLHGLQVLWYVGLGALALGSRHVSFAEIRAAKNEPTEDP